MKIACVEVWAGDPQDKHLSCRLGLYHLGCLQALQAPYKAEMAEHNTNCCSTSYPHAVSYWAPGHPDLPAPCMLCKKEIARGEGYEL